MPTNLALASIKSTGSSASRTFGDRFADIINVKDYGAKGDGSTDDTAAIQAAFTAAMTSVVATKAVFFPTGRYRHTGLAVAGSIALYGALGLINWNGGNDAPTGSPATFGAVLVCDSNGSNGITVSGVSTQLNLENINFEFATPFSGTGDHINYIPTGTNTGFAGFSWRNVAFYGHDGNHYAANMQNPILGKIDGFYSWGGGVLKIVGNGTTNYGNITFSQLYGYVYVGGTANGVTLSASALQKLNLLMFVRPQIGVYNKTGVTPSGNVPTSAQSIWVEDTNVTNIKKIGCDFETNVSSGITLGQTTFGSDFDWASLFTTAGSINSAAWGVHGVEMFLPGKTWKDTTSAGATGDTAIVAIGGSTVQAASAATYSVLASLYVTAPLAGTNVTATKLRAIYANGAIESNSSVTCVGLSASGATNINIGSGLATQIGNGGGTLGVGVAADNTKATLLLAASTTARASLVIPPGVAPTTPADGAFIYDGTNLKFQVGAVTKTVTLT